MSPSTRAAAIAAALSLAACAQTDIVGYRALAGCMGPSCAPLDSGTDAGGDGGGVLDAGDAGDAGGGVCAAATCDVELMCAAPVPRAIVGDSCGDQPWDAPAFRHALCSCDDYVSEFPLTVSRSPASAEQGAASVAIDGTLTAGARLQIAGAVYVAGDVELDDGVAIDADAVEGNTSAPRCDCSQSVALAPAAVLSLAPQNPPGFDAERFGSVQTDEMIALDCGAYRIPRIAGPSGLTLAITGHVVLVVEGDIALDASLEATLAEGALLELFVIGNMRVAGALTLGEGGGGVRLYVLGSGTIDLNSEAFVAGPIYAPNAELVTRSSLGTTGPIFVRRAAPGGAVSIQYDSAESHATSCDQ